MCWSCELKQPELFRENQETVEIYQLCYSSRDLNGNLDGRVMLDIMDSMDIDKEDKLDIFKKIQRIEIKSKLENSDKNNFEKNSHENIKQRIEQNKSNMKV